MQNKRTKVFRVGMLSGLIAIVLAAGGCGNRQSAEALISEAKAFREKGDNNSAIIQLKNALQKNPDDAQARYLLGATYVDTGDPVSAEKELRKALSLGMNEPNLATSLGKALYMLGQYQKALSETDLAVSQRADSGLLTLRGDAYLALGKPAEAKQAFERALTAQANFPEALIGLARHALMQKDVGAAMQFAERAAASNPKNPKTWSFKGDLLRAQGKVDDALAAFDEVLKLSPGDHRAHLAKAALEINTRKFAAARANIEAARKTAGRDPAVLYTLAVLDHTEGKNAAAWESLQQVLRVAPKHPPSLLLAGTVQSALGSNQQAEHYLKSYLEQNPRNLTALRLYAATLFRNGDGERASSLIASALKEEPQNADLLALAGETEMRTGNFRKATEYFENAKELAPNKSMIHTALGASRLAQGDNARAIADLEASLDVDPKSRQASMMLLMTHVRQKQFDKALAVINKLEKAQPNDPLVHNVKGGIYSAKKDTAAARASFEKAVSLQPNYFSAVSNLAQLDVQEKKPEAAKKRIESFLESNSKNVAAMTALASLASLQKRPEEATRWLERASNENPGQMQPAMRLGGYYLNIGQMAKALELAQKLQAAHPGDAQALDFLAQVQVANGDKTGALESYNKIAAAAPNSATVQYRIGSIHLSMQDEAAAITHLKKALSIKPHYVEAQLTLAALDARRGDHESALATVRKLQTQAPKSPIGYEFEGDIFVAQKKYPQAIKAYEQALAKGKNGLTMIKIHDAYRRSGNDKEGMTRLVQWVKDNPADSALRLHLGTVHLVNKKNKSAIEQFEAILQQSPSHVAALNNLALAYHHERDPRALEYAEKAYQLAETSAPVMDTLGWILVEQGNTSHGLPLLQKAASLAPAFSDIRYHLAQALAKSGDNAGAKKELEQLLASGKTFAGVDDAKQLLRQLQ
ncbi:MAG: hypothetical protein JWM42_1538 [Burkholderia sp.]|nr:hypothetical protein [Burkholderia sp.]